MSFIGKEGRPAPKLKDAADHMSAKDLELAYQQVVEMMEQLYTVCHLVHADLSEYNILWYEKEVWFIDVTQAVESIHPSGLDFLLRDRPGHWTCEEEQRPRLFGKLGTIRRAKLHPDQNCALKLQEQITPRSPKTPVSEIVGLTEGSHFIL